MLTFNEGLRQRKTINNEEIPPLILSLSESVKQVDIFPKVNQESEHRISTSQGATVTLISLFFLSILLIYITSQFSSTSVVEHMKVDVTEEPYLNISLDIALYNIHCHNAQLDVMDVVGSQVLNYYKSLYKERINHYGKSLGVYPPPHGHSINKDEGCRVYGSIRINKVSGNFHFAAGESIAIGSKHIHHFQSHDISQYNISHHIYHLSFGEEFPNQENPLNHQHFIQEKAGGIYQYFFKIVPIRYQSSSYPIISAEYSVTENYMSTSLFQLPGLFFIYDLSPFMIDIVEQPSSLLHLLVNICAVLGGAFSIFTLIDRIYHYLYFKTT